MKYTIGDFIFNHPDLKEGDDNEKSEKQYRLDEKLVMKMMYLHYAFYGQFQEENEYVKSGSILKCNAGTKLSKFDILKDHGVVEKDGTPIGICSDCKVEENIHTFGYCFNTTSPEGYPKRKKEKTIQGSPVAKCIPMLYGGWCKTGDKEVYIWDEEKRTFSETITTGDYLPCLYGGKIYVVEVPEKSPTAGADNSSQLTYIQLNTNNIRPAVLDRMNHYIDKIKTMNDSETCWESMRGYYNAKWTRADYERTLDILLSDLASPTGASIENVMNRTCSVITGSLQLVGGITEAGTGMGIATGTSWTGVGIPIGIAGGYIFIDGVSNVTGGFSKIHSALAGSNQGDTFNFVKWGYMHISPEYGEEIYNATQIGIGLFCIGKGLIDLPKDAVSVYARPKNIKRVNVEGLSTKTIAIDVGDEIVLTTQTDSGMILQKTIIDKWKLDKGTLFIGIDTVNTNSAASSIKQE